MKTSARRLRGWLADLRFSLSAAPVGERSAARDLMTLSSGAIGAAAAQQQGVHRSAAAAAAAAARSGSSAAACARPQAVPQQLRVASLPSADRKRSLLQRAVAAAAGSTSPGGTAAAAAVQAGVPQVVPFPATGLPSSPPSVSSLAAAAEATAAPDQVQPAAEAAAAAPSSPFAVAAGSVSVEGTVQRITFRADDTGYTVLRLQLPPSSLTSSSDGSASEVEDYLAAATASAAAAGPAARGKRGKPKEPAQDKPKGKGKDKDKRIIIVVGNLPQIAVGQTLRLRGRWVEHRQYGLQLQATDLEELPASNNEELAAYLGGGAIPGVGPVYARRMVETWGVKTESKLNSKDAVRWLTQCSGITAKKAAAIKEAWDATKGTRDGVMFLREQSLPLPLAQRVAERHGPQTVARIQQDPYVALAGFGLPFSKVDQLAAKVGADPHLVSRAAMAIQQALGAAAADEGHTFLPWHRLEKDCGRLLRDAGLQHGNPWQHTSALHLVSQHMHCSGALVAEPAPPAASAKAGTAAPTAAEGQAVEAAAGGEAAAHEAAAEAHEAAAAAAIGAPTAVRVHPSFEGIAELRRYLRERLKGVPAATVDALLDTHGEQAPAVLDLDLPQAVEELRKCPRVGPKTAEKMKLAWEAAHGNLALAAAAEAARSAAASPLATAPGLTMGQLLESPPAVGFPWGHATRCYSTHLHAAEEVVAQRSLQRAAAYKPPSTRLLNKIRKWLEANQSATEVKLNDGQERAIEVASDAPLMVLTGGPGCGKTTAVQTIVKLWCAQKKMVRIAAPTGRAAQRMGEIQGIEPCTIHRLLGYQPRRANGSGEPGMDVDAAAEEARLGTQGAFNYNRTNPLPADAVLIDEASMLSLPLAAALMDALKPKCQLVLVGDVDQLPPVGPGSVLQSLIASQLVPVVDLREIFRQAAQSAIITSALAVRRGEVPLLQPVDPTPSAVDAATSDALLVAAGPQERLTEAVKSTVNAMRSAHGYTSGEEGTDLQVISPMRKGPAGTTTLNPMLQALLNPPRPGKAELLRHASAAHAVATATVTSSSDDSGSGSSSSSSSGGPISTAAHQEAKVFRVGDRVIQQVNNYDKDVFNGDQGTVVSCKPADRQLVVRFPHLDKGGASGMRTYQGVELSQLELAYAITVHKAQGGEAAHVVLALSREHGRMLTRRLLYTGLTRAKQQLVVVSAGGEAGADPLAHAVRRKDSESRLTSLQSRLEAGRVEAELPELPLQSFSNEDQMLQQAAIWQQQAAERAAAQRVAAAATRRAATAQVEQVQRGWAAAQGGGENGAVAHSDSSSGCGSAASSSSSLSPADAALQGEVAAELQQLGMQANEARNLVHWVWHNWPASFDAVQQQQAVAWLQPRLNLQHAEGELAQLAPHLLGAVGQLEGGAAGSAGGSTSSSSADSGGDGEASGSSGSDASAHAVQVLSQLVRTVVQAAPLELAPSATEQQQEVEQAASG